MPDGAPAGRRASTPDPDAAVRRRALGGEPGGRRLVPDRAVLVESDPVGDLAASTLYSTICTAAFCALSPPINLNLHKPIENDGSVGEQEETESVPCQIRRLVGATSNLRV